MRNKVIATTSAMALALGMVVAPVAFDRAMAQDTPPAAGAETTAPTGAMETETTNDAPATGADATTTTTTDTGTTAAAAGPEQPPGTMLSEDLIGASVEGPDGDSVATIDKLILESDGKASHAVLRIGGLLGMGGKQVMVPWEDLQVSGDEDVTVRIMASQEQLEEMPEFQTQAEVRREQERAAAPAGGGGMGGAGGTGGGMGGGTQ